MNPIDNAKKLGYRVVYVPHEIIKDYNACYRVEYDGKIIYPPAADKLGIPLNEIWISEIWRPYEKYVLFHELQEIKHRAEGLDVEQAHNEASKDEIRVFKGDPIWERLKREINIAPKEILKNVDGIGDILAKRIMENRPYDSMEELLRVRGIGRKRLKNLKNMMWCIGDYIENLRN